MADILAWKAKRGCHSNFAYKAWLTIWLEIRSMAGILISYIKHGLQFTLKNKAWLHGWHSNFAYKAWLTIQLAKQSRDGILTSYIEHDCHFSLKTKAWLAL